MAWTGDEGDPVGVKTRDKGNGDSVGATVAATASANLLNVSSCSITVKILLLELHSNSCNTTRGRSIVWY